MLVGIVVFVVAPDVLLGPVGSFGGVGPFELAVLALVALVIAVTVSRRAVPPATSP